MSGPSQTETALRLTLIKNTDASGLQLTEWSKDWGELAERAGKAYENLRAVMAELDDIRVMAERMSAISLGAAASWNLASTLLKARTAQPTKEEEPQA